MSTNAEKDAFVRKAEAVYNETLKDQLEADHFGKLIALDPETGDYVLATRFRDLELACFEKFGYQPTQMFRVGGGGAVRVGGSSARLP